jgi:enolase-phosphatase E1
VRIDDEARRIRVVLLDIEGTTTAIDFVTKSLFPYAAAKLGGFLREHAHDPEIEKLITELRVQRDADERAGLQPGGWSSAGPDQVRSAITYVEWLMERDSKCTPLKSLQGMIWREGYARGELHGHVYEDVPRAMERWKQQGRTIAIYSSGSVLAQQLLFNSTTYGDLTRYISAFFDTQTGPKVESSSYSRIAAALGQSASEILFLSDAQKEIDAAQGAGMRTALCIRTPQSGAKQSAAVFNFDDVLPT